MRRFERSRAAFSRAREWLPGGVSSPVRAFKAVGGDPVFLERGEGCRVIDVDGNSYIDYVGSWGPLILGHADPGVVAAIREAAARGSSFGAPCELESRLAEEVCRRFAGMVDQVRFVSSGTEATMSAIRVARGFTGRDKLVKCDGCYHGHADGLLVQAGSGATTLGTPTSPGVTRACAADTISIPFNDASSFEEACRAHPGEIAAIIVEPVAGNMGCIPPAADYLAELRRICDDHDVLLILDEVMTGLRLHAGGVSTRLGVRPDIVCLGKVLGGGLPIGGFGGRRELMCRLAPDGDIYQAGTLSGNPLAMAAGLATLERLDAAAYDCLDRTGQRLAQGLREAAAAAGGATCVQSVGSMSTCFFQPGPVTCYQDALRSDTDAYARFFRGMLEAGIYLAPSQFEVAFVSLAHDDAALEETLAVARAVFAQVL